MIRKSFTGEDVSVSGPYSHVVDAGNYLFFSGQVAKNSTTYVEETGSIEEQTKQCFKNLEAVLTAADVSFDDVVKVNVYLIRSEKYIDELMLLFKRFFIDDFNFFLVHKE